MGLGNWVFDELKVANSCYMAAAIEFSTTADTQTTPSFTSSLDPSLPTSQDMSSSTY